MEHRVARVDRRDLGVWMRIDGGEAGLALPRPDPDPGFGRTWLTELRWSGRRLIVVSCGEVACRFRELDPWSGAVRSLADPSLGSFVGAAGDTLVVRGACRGLPCPVLGADLATGSVRTLVHDAGPAIVADDALGEPVVVTASPDGLDLRAVRLDGAAIEIPPSDPDAALAGAMPELGVELPPGWIPLLGSGEPLARRFDTPTSRRLDEVRP
jgi:hypothetical protein